MEQEILKKRFAICLLFMLAVAFLFSVKGVWDSRRRAHYTKRIEKIQAQFGMSLDKHKLKPLLSERSEAQKKVTYYYGFPKFFFFFFVIVFTALSIWAVSIFKKYPPGTRAQRRSILRMALALVTFMIIIGCFLLVRYHRVVQLGWVLLLLLFQWIVIGGVGAICLSDEVYGALMGTRKGKDIIEGPPPSAW